MGGVQIIMDYVRDAQYQNYYSAGSDTSEISALTDPNGTYYNPGKRTPAVWSFVWGQNGAQPQCWSAFDNDFQIVVPPASASVFAITCKDPPDDTELQPATEQNAAFSPASINLASPPASVTATGSGFSAQYGSQIVQFYDANGNLADQETANTNSSTSLTINLPGLSPGDGGAFASYLGIIMNEDANGYYYAVGTASLKVRDNSVSCNPLCTQ
jgi:hypothetical protein